jgi:hypothetical protein
MLHSDIIKSVKEEKIMINTMMKELRKELKKINKLNREYGFDEYRLEFIRNEIWFIGEFDYDEGSMYADKFNEILKKYDNRCYFDADCPGRWVAYVF